MVLACRVDETSSQSRQLSSSVLSSVAQLACSGFIRCTVHSVRYPRNVLKCDHASLDPRTNPSLPRVCGDLVSTALYFKKKVEPASNSVRCLEASAPPEMLVMNTFNKEGDNVQCDLKFVVDRDVEGLRVILEHFQRGEGISVYERWEDRSDAIESYWRSKINDAGDDSFYKYLKEVRERSIDNTKLREQLSTDLIERFEEDMKKRITDTAASGTCDVLKHQYECSQRALLHLLHIWTMKYPELPSEEEIHKVVLLNDSHLHDFKETRDRAFGILLENSEYCAIADRRKAGCCKFEIVYPKTQYPEYY